MDIITPDYEDIPILNVDFGFAFGGTAAYTLYPNDTLEDLVEEIVLTIAAVGEVRVQKRNIAFWTRKNSILRRKLPKKPSVAQES